MTTLIIKKKMTLLIKNVQPLGSSRKLPPRVDIFISDDKISAFGNFSSKGADETIDGRGAYISPGFIDVNTDSDRYSDADWHTGYGRQ